MNKRPLPCVLAGFVLGEVWIWQFHGTAALAALCLAVIICFIIGSLKKGSFFILLALGLLIGGFRTHNWNLQKDAMAEWMKGDSHLIQGQIEEVEEKEYSYAVIIHNLSVDHSFQGGRLLLYLDEKPTGFIGSTILVKGSIRSFDLPTNPGGFNLRTYREGKGILGLVSDAELVKVTMGSFLMKDLIYNIREKATDYISANMKEEYSGIGIAMAFGKKDKLLEEQKSLYEFGGISHVLAVSGLHMSLLGAAVYKLLRKAGAGYGLSVFASMPCIFIYGVMTGMSSSCFRAGIMLCIYLFAQYKGYYYDLPSALSLAAIWLLFEIPARLFDSGFLLSFGAMISVGILCPFFFQIFQYKTEKRKILDSFLSGMMITVFTLPLSLYFFYGSSLAGLVLNLMVIPLMTFLVPLLFIGGMGWLWFVPDFCALFCFKIGEGLLWFYHVLCSFAKGVPFSYIQAGYRGLGFSICYYVILAVMIGVLYLCKCPYEKTAGNLSRQQMRNKKRKRLYFAALPMFLGILIIFVYLTGRNDSFLTVLDVGQGDGILYHTEYGEVCMIDGGSTSERNVGRYVIKPALEYYGIDRVDYWFVSHFDEDHISGLKELLESGFPVSNLVLPVRKEVSEKQLEIENLARQNGTRIHVMKQGDKLTLKNSVVYCLYPKNNKSQDENQNSMVLLLNTSGQQILLTGDVEKEGELDMVKQLKKYKMDKSKEQILKVGHHGSANGTKEELLNTFEPDSAIISCAFDNSYGHPAMETVDRIKESGSVLYYTMNYGAVEIRLGKETSYLGYGVVK